VPSARSEKLPERNQVTNEYLTSVKLIATSFLTFKQKINQNNLIRYEKRKRFNWKQFDDEDEIYKIRKHSNNIQVQI
jgi:hypothetical protein